eukprot:EG_transcript_8657
MELEVDVAFHDDDAIAAVCRARNWTAVELFAAPSSHQLNVNLARKRHSFRYYSFFLVLTDDLPGALPHLQTLPAAASILWAHGSGVPWPTTAALHFQRLLKFDYVWFDNANWLRMTSLLVNPMGHRPPSFRLVTSSPPPGGFPLAAVQNALRFLQGNATGVQPPVLEAPGHSHRDAQPASQGPLLRMQTVPQWRSFCPRRRHWVRLALAVHLASHPAKYLRPVFTAIHAIDPIQAHLWLTFFPAENRRPVLLAAREAGVVTHVLGVRNKGLDIGPFFTVLWQILCCRYRYDYVLKFHFKSNARDAMARQAAMFFRVSTLLQTAVEALDNETAWAAVWPHIAGDAVLLFPDSNVWFAGANRAAMTEIAEALGVPWAKVLLIGNVFLGRMRAFTDAFRSAEQVWRFYTQLTDIDGLDWRWYNRFYFHGHCDRAAVEWHYLHRGVFHGFRGNVYAMPNRHQLARDGMVEHAWERILSFMLSARGAIVPLPVPADCHPP